MNKKIEHLKGKTVTQKTLNCVIVKNVIDEQYGNLTQRHRKKDGSYKQVTGILQKFAKTICRIVMNNSTAPTLIAEWKKEFSIQTSIILESQGLEIHIKNTIKDMKFRFPNAINDDLLEYSLLKIANYSGSCARMIFHKQHPDCLL